MQDYKKQVEALRLCQFGECGCGKCYYKELKGDWCTEDNHPEFFDCDDKLKLDAADAIEALQAEVKRLKEANDELRESQTYIDHYGDRWMTSAKDVPTSAYEHGYADGRDEAEAQLLKRGKWIWKHRHHGGFKTAKGKCECGRDVYAQIDERYETDDPYCPFCGVMNDSIHLNYCPNCGADMRKMEVQDGE